MTTTDNLLDINGDTISNTSPIIKVIGVGGGGGNAVNHMYKEGIEHITYLLCNTDRQHLQRCSIPHKLCIGENRTRGLGAGDKPEVAKEAAEESEEEIRRALNDGTRMAFITAGMGGGTGTGAAPVVARIAKEMGILTVGIVTIPFLFEGQEKILKALDGLDEMSKNIDAMLVINNELLRFVYSDLNIMNALDKADDTLTIATRSISDVITRDDIVNLDFADIHTTLSNGGVAIVSHGYGSGKNAVIEAIDSALNSPLLNSANVAEAGRILLHVSFSKESAPQMDAIQEQIGEFTGRLKGRYGWIWGYGLDESLGDKVKVIILASGFSLKDAKPNITNEKDLNRIREYYKQAMGDSIVLASKPKSVIFEEDELDNDIFISFIQDTPTLRRVDSMIERFRTPKEGATAGQPSDGGIKEGETAASGSASSASGTSDKGQTEENKEHDNDREWDSDVITFGKK